MDIFDLYDAGFAIAPKTHPREFTMLIHIMEFGEVEVTIVPREPDDEPV